MDGFIIKGNPVSTGLASGTGAVVSYDTVGIPSGKCTDISAELIRFEESRRRAMAQIEEIVTRRGSALGDQEKQIFAAHLMMLDDPEFIEQVRGLISQDRTNAAQAVDITAKAFSEIFSALPDPYLAERGRDVLDIGARIVRNLSGTSHEFPSNTAGGIILICRDIPPSAVAELDPEMVRAVIAAEGGFTSHAAILLKNLEIPAIFGLAETNLSRLDQRHLLVDAQSGKIMVDPSPAEKSEFQQRLEKFNLEAGQLAQLAHAPGCTADGARIQLLANVGGLQEIPRLEKVNPDGVGLFRTEFLFLHRRSAPSENEQTEIYRKMLEAMGSRKTIIRTLDIGGDKDVPYLKLAKEENPFLGVRGLRYCLQNQEIFRTQLRALLRASPAGNLHIMHPMVTTIAELDEANGIMAEEMAGLTAAGVAVSPSIKVGIMIEVPAAALMADVFAQKVDFMSLGTNDLTQYTCACDRLNPGVKSLYNTCEPGVLRLIKLVADAAERHQTHLSICGEMAGQPHMTPFFLGIGIRNLSMSPPLIPHLKRRLAALTMGACAEIAGKVLACSSVSEVSSILN